MTAEDQVALLSLQCLGPGLVGMLVGFVISRFTLSKKEAKDVQLGNYGNTERLIDEHDRSYDAYSNALAAYVTRAEPTIENFIAIATCGDRYFDRLNQISSAILGGNVDPQMRDDLLLPKVRSAVERTVPDHFDTLQKIAKKRGIQNPAELRRSDFTALYAVVETYGPTRNW